MFHCLGLQGNTEPKCYSAQRLAPALVLRGTIKIETDPFYGAGLERAAGCQHFLAHCVAKIYEATIHRPLNSLSSLHLHQMYNVLGGSKKLKRGQS